jgi:hypothetical protein
MTERKLVSVMAENWELAFERVCIQHENAVAIEIGSTETAKLAARGDLNKSTKVYDFIIVTALPESVVKPKPTPARRFTPAQAQLWRHIESIDFAELMPKPRQRKKGPKK